jgi:hypothetical protein
VVIRPFPSSIVNGKLLVKFLLALKSSIATGGFSSKRGAHSVAALALATVRNRRVLAIRNPERKGTLHSNRSILAGTVEGRLGGDAALFFVMPAKADAQSRPWHELRA